MRSALHLHPEGSGAGTPAKPGGSRKALASAAMKQHEECPSCTIGYPIPISGDENGTVFKCFHCGFGYSIPADAESQFTELATVSADISTSKLNAVARKYGIDPSDYGTKAELHGAMVAAGEKGLK